MTQGFSENEKRAIAVSHLRTLSPELLAELTTNSIKLHVPAGSTFHRGVRRASEVVAAPSDTPAPYLVLTATCSGHAWPRPSCPSPSLMRGLALCVMLH